MSRRSNASHWQSLGQSLGKLQGNQASRETGLLQTCCPPSVYYTTSSHSCITFPSPPLPSCSKMQAIARPLARVAPKHVRYAGSLSVWSAVPAGPPDPILGTWRSSRTPLLYGILPEKQMDMVWDALATTPAAVVPHMPLLSLVCATIGRSNNTGFVLTCGAPL